MQGNSLCSESTLKYVNGQDRIGMHLLFYGRHQIELLHNKTVEEHMMNLSIKVTPDSDSLSHH
jgi:hypothetical protein